MSSLKDIYGFSEGELRQCITLYQRFDLEEFNLKIGNCLIEIKNFPSQNQHNTHTEAHENAIQRAQLQEGDLLKKEQKLATQNAGIEEKSPGYAEVTSPIAGTFYQAVSPGAAPFVQVGDSVKVGQTLCIVEAMKHMNEVKSPFAGEIMQVLVQNEQAVTKEQVLFLLTPGGI